jgi:hypothetical protein
MLFPFLLLFLAYPQTLLSSKEFLNSVYVFSFLGHRFDTDNKTATPPPPPHSSSNLPDPQSRPPPNPPTTLHPPHPSKSIPRLHRYNPLDRRPALRLLHLLPTTPLAFHPPRSSRPPERSKSPASSTNPCFYVPTEFPRRTCTTYY